MWNWAEISPSVHHSEVSLNQDNVLPVKESENSATYSCYGLIYYFIVKNDFGPWNNK